VSTPLVTVVVPTFNYGRFLGEALASIRAQTVRDRELLVIDDGSTDDTPAVLARHAAPDLVARRTDRIGVAAARALGRDHARGRYVAYLDADDLWRPTYLERQLALLEAEPEVGFSFTDFVRTEGGRPLPETNFDLVRGLRALPTRPARGGGGRVLEGDTFARLAPLSDLPGWLQTTVYRREALAGVRPKPGGQDAEDLYWQLQVYRRARAGYVDEPLVEVRRHGGNSYTRGDAIRDGVLATVQQAARDLDLAPAERAVLHRRIGDECLRRGYRWFWAHDARRAAHYYWRALRWPGTTLDSLAHLAALPLLPLLPRREPAF
jgi:glycosyltransferase involved in cell wall biosynthesis